MSRAVQTIRIHVTDRWTPQEGASFLLDVHDLYNLRFALERVEEALRSVEKRYENLIRQGS